jgi:hypothetical protein
MLSWECKPAWRRSTSGRCIPAEDLNTLRNMDAWAAAQYAAPDTDAAAIGVRDEVQRIHMALTEIHAVPIFAPGAVNDPRNPPP